VWICFLLAACAAVASPLLEEYAFPLVETASNSPSLVMNISSISPPYVLRRTFQSYVRLFLLVNVGFLYVNWVTCRRLHPFRGSCTIF
jgi:hypothetical protein